MGVVPSLVAALVKGYGIANISVTIMFMGEWNSPAADAETINGHWVEYLAKYLYENYETDPHPMRDDDPRNTYIGAVEPWESVGKRMREKWLQAAYDLMLHTSKALLGVDVNALAL